MVVVVRFESWLGLSLLPSFENIYIYIFYVLWILTRSLWRYERRDRTGRKWESFRCLSIPIRTPFEPN